MKSICVFFLLSISTSWAQMSDSEANRIVDAIYRVEGSERAKVPYGILSIKVRDKAHARQICLNTVRNNYRRWSEAGRKGEYLEFLADRYCPRSVDPQGNTSWKRNIKLILKRKTL